jgi:subtilisin family serine protease
VAETAHTSDKNIVDGNEIAVATSHVGLVRHALDVRGVPSRVRDESRDLGLTLLTLPDGEIRHAVQGDQESASKPLSRLMRLLYQDFRDEYGGWVPTMGKNRRVLPVTGAHTIEGGGAGVPSAAHPHFAPRAGEPGRGVRVGIADTALYANPWLAGSYQAAPASMWEDQGSAPEYAVGHATFVAGLVLQRAPGATLEARRVLGANAEADSWDVAKDLVLFARSGLDVLNLSFGCFTEDNRSPLVLSTALERLGSRVVVVAAAGNHGATAYARHPMWPAALEQVVAVGATDGAGGRPAWSPDPELPWIDVVAPGEDVTSTYLLGKVDLRSDGGAPDEPFDGFAQWSGTSFSAAQVSGAVAAGIIPGETGASTALAQVLASAAKTPGSSVPWIR